MDKQFDLNEFIAFVASKPADEEYDFCDPYRCVVAQFQRVDGSYEGPLGNGELDELYPDLAEILNEEATFGALSERLSRLSTGEG